MCLKTRLNSTGNPEVKRDIGEGGCVSVCWCVGLLAKYTLFIMQERRPHRERVGLFKRLVMACLLALALIPSHLPVSQDSHINHKEVARLLTQIHFNFYFFYFILVLTVVLHERFCKL